MSTEFKPEDHVGHSLYGDCEETFAATTRLYEATGGGSYFTGRMIPSEETSGLSFLVQGCHDCNAEFNPEVTI